MPREKRPRDPDLERLGARIKALRVAAGYDSGAAFADYHGIPATQYVRLESGQNATYKTLLEIVRLHNLTLSDFFSEGFN